MRTILYQPVYINPQAYFVFPSLYHIEKGDSYVEPAVYTGQLLIDVVDGSASSVIIKDTKQVDFSDYAGKHIRISQYTDEGAVVLGEWLIPSNQVYLDSHLVDAWFMSGYSNDNPPDSISGYKGHELVLKNFAFAGSSGFGKYSVNKITWVNTNCSERIDVDYLTYTFVNITESNNSILQYVEGGKRFSAVGNIVKVRVAGIPEGGKVNIGNYITNITEDGVYEGSYTYDTNGNTSISTANCIGATITVEFLPDNAGSLVLDGVDDYAVCDNMPIQTDYTVICRRQIWDKQNDNETVVASKSLSYDTGAFIFEFLKNSTKDQCRSFGTLSSILVEKSDSISYQTSTSYNGTNITKGTGTDTDILYLGNTRKNDNRYLYGAIYYFALYDKSLTPDEIEQEKIKLNEIWTKRLNR